MYTNIKKQFSLAYKKLLDSDVIPSEAFLSIKDENTKCFALNDTSVEPNDVCNNIIIVDFDGNVIEGDSNGIDPYFMVHKAIYNSCADITTIVNPRSRWNCIWAQLGRSLSPSSFFYTKYFSGETLCTGAITLEPGEDLYDIIGKAINNRLLYKGIQSRGAIIVRNDSAIIWGKNPEATVERAIAMEEICFRAIQTTAITNGGDSFVAWEVSEQLLEQE